MSGLGSYILSGPEDDLRIPNESIGKYLYDCLKRRNSNDVVNADAITEEVLTCGRLLEESIKLCAALKNLGLKKGDVIVLVSENSINYCVPLLAALYMGVTVVLLNPGYATGELKQGLLMTKAKLIFCSEGILKNVLKVKEELKFIETIVLMDLRTENNYNIQTMENLLETINVDTEDFQPDTFDCSTQGAFVLLSSGTTGLPKSVLITHQNFRSPINYLSHPKYGNVLSQDVTVSVLPPFHIFGLILQILAITSSMKLILLNNFKPDIFLRSMQENKVTKLFFVPPLLSFLAKHPLVDSYDISTVKYILVGGAPIGKSLLNEASKRLSGVTIRQIYGLTEATGVCTFQTIDMTNFESAGTLIPQMMAKVWDEDLKENLGPLKVGELCFKGPMIMKGYLGNTISTEQCIDPDGFLHTGDIGYYDEDERFYMVARMKELIKYKGFQVPPAELEALILSHPGVCDCGVIGIPHERAGQVPLAYVVRHKDTNITEQDVVDYVAERISVQKHLYGGVIFIEEIPKNPTGKILRRKLVDMFDSSKTQNV